MKTNIIYCNLQYLFFSLMFIIGCNNTRDQKTYIYDYFNNNGKFCYHQNRLLLENNKNGQIKATLLSNNIEKKFIVEHKSHYVNIDINNISTTLYTSLDSNIHYNKYEEDLQSPYFVNNTRFLESKIFQVGQKKFTISLFGTNNLSSLFNLAYYCPDYGFIIYNNRETGYQKLVDILDGTPEEKVALKELTDKLISDSTFFYNQHPVKTPITFYLPKMKR